MGETLKERLDRLSHTAQQGTWGQFSMSYGPWQEEAKGAWKRKEYVNLDTSHDVSTFIDGKPVRVGTFKHASTAEFVESLVNAYRSGDLIPRDAITPAMAAEWQPIETAYVSGVMTTRARVLLCVPPYGTGSGNWDGLKWNCHFCLNKEAQPTHWMPLPEPPALTAIKETDNDE